MKAVLSTAPARSDPRMWDEKQADQVESIALRDGLTLVLNDISSGSTCSYHYVKRNDAFDIGFHLRRGSTVPDTAT